MAWAGRQGRVTLSKDASSDSFGGQAFPTSRTPVSCQLLALLFACTETTSEYSPWEASGGSVKAVDAFKEWKRAFVQQKLTGWEMPGSRADAEHP